ncbi:AsmA family protein [Thiomicrorhabdus heinhorstiae]|uniref:AsmA family protein n=1 Tax=Thiomicrorhabdus heinhorstiae TaxID=2748010 RepID=A0ABS0BWU0_9GAMM|nr:AsmA family protein [Thiomicrorhabdus heinhorstiae]MBF6058273.1 AsmA family protein [Thiomicrorhabdus heinhorstiae]
MKAVSLILKILAATIIVLIAAIGILIAVVDPNDYRGEITELVEKQTGRDLQIGNMSLSFYPKLGLQLDEVQLSNAKGFGETPFLQAQKVQVGAAILPLLSKELQIDALALYGLKLNLQKDAEGHTNWDDLVAKGLGEEDKDESHDEKSDGGENPLDQLAALSFGGLDIQDGELVWKDAQAQQEVRISDLTASTGSIEFGEFFPIHFSAKTQLKNPDINNQLALDIEAKLERDGQYSVRNLQLETQADGQALPVSGLLASLKIPTLNLALEKQQIDLPQLQLSVQAQGKSDFPLKQLDVQGNLQNISVDLNNQVATLPKMELNAKGDGQGDFPLKHFDNKLEINGLQAQIDQQAVSMDSLKMHYDLKGDVLPNGALQADLTAKPSLNLSKQTAELSAVQLTAGDLKINAEVKAQKIMDNPQAQASVNLNPLNLRKWLEALKITLPEMSDPATLNQVAAKVNVEYDQGKQAVKVNNLQVDLDQSKLQGSAQVSQFAKPNIRYDLTLDQIDLNRYLPKTKTEEATQPASKEDIEIPLPEELLKSMTVDGTVKVGSLKVQKLQPKNILVTLKAKNGKWQLSPTRADIFGTQLSVQAGLDVSGKTPQYSAKVTAPKVPVGDVMLAFTDNDMLSGTGSVNTDLTTSGRKLSELKQNLNGNVSSDLIDGAVKGFNLAQSIREAKAKLSGETLPATDEVPQTDFSELLAKLKITNGVANIESLSALAPFMRISAEGKANIVTEQMNVLVNAKIVESDKGQGGKEFQDLSGLTIPVRLKGAMVSPAVSLDLASLFEQKAKMELEQKKQEAIDQAKKAAEEKKEEVIEDVKKQATDKLKDLFKF